MLYAAPIAAAERTYLQQIQMTFLIVYLINVGIQTKMLMIEEEASVLYLNVTTS